MLLEIIKYASSGIIPFLVTISVLTIIAYAIAGFSIVKIEKNDNRNDTNNNPEINEYSNKEGDK